jgi:hypothetical protein
MFQQGTRDKSIRHNLAHMILITIKDFDREQDWIFLKGMQPLRSDKITIAPCLAIKCRFNASYFI